MTHAECIRDLTTLVVELAMISIIVFDDEAIGASRFIGQCAAPLLSIQRGYGNVQLRSLGEQVMNQATLFVHVTIELHESVIEGEEYA